MARAECERCGNELTDQPAPGSKVEPDGWAHVDYPAGCPNGRTGYMFVVTVTTDTAEHAAQVMRERIEPEEDYGFPYEVEYALAPWKVDGESFE